MSADIKAEESSHIPDPANPLLEKAKLYFLSAYEPVSKLDSNTTTMTTEEIWQNFQALIKNEIEFTRADCAAWLHEKGYTFTDMAVMRFEWLLKKVS